jgi:hypothetical protein
MASSYLLQESGSKFTEETSSGFFLLEVQPTTVTNFVSGFPRAVTIRLVAGRFEMDTGSGIMKSQFSSMLALIARNAGATQIRYED